MPGAKKDKTTEAPWSVFDKNARQMGPQGSIGRIHEPVEGRTYKLHFDIPCEMPEAHARKFLRDESFEVRDSAGNRVLPLGEAQRSRKPPEKLAPDQVVAHVTELTDTALLTRVALTAGGAAFDADTPREELVEFLIYGNNLIARPGAADVDGDDMSQAELSKIDFS